MMSYCATQTMHNFLFPLTIHAIYIELDPGFLLSQTGRNQVFEGFVHLQAVLNGENHVWLAASKLKL